MEQSTQLDQSALQDLLGGSTPSLIPESLITTLTVGFVVLNLLALLFFVFYVFSLIRKWKVESAMLKMQKDIADIKTALVQQSQPTESHAHAEPARPAQSSAVIATNESADSDRGTPGNLA